MRLAGFVPAASGWCFLALCVPRCWAMAIPQPIRYVLDLRQPSTHLIRVTMTIPSALPATKIQFPAWNGLYQIRDFVRNVHEVRAECDGEPLELVPVDLETWRTGPAACRSLEVRYAVYADEEGVFSTVLNDRHAFMNLAQLLFYLPQARDRSARVRFLLPSSWKLSTLLDDGETPGEYKAQDYDALADSPAEAGEFQEYRYTQSGATFRVVVHADPHDYSSARLLESIQRITAAEIALMREAPFTRYTFILHFTRGGGDFGMEHRNGAAISVPAGNLRRHWDGLEATVAHEFFHLWNVKRIRPQGLEPVDYVHGNDTRDLWFSEGVTSTYEQLVLLRAGLLTRRTFYQRLADEIQHLEERPGRHFQTLELSSLEAWLEKYPDYLRPERSISYYNKGELLGFLLDLALRNASRNQKSLDDVMRGLNQEFARQQRSFTQTDLRALIGGLVPSFTGLDAFFRDFLLGTRELDFDTYLGYAGLRPGSERLAIPVLGFHALRNSDGIIQVQSVDPGSSAEKRGLKAGDVLLRMNGEPLTDLPEDQLGELRPGQRVKFGARREDREFDVKFVTGTRQVTTYRVEEIPDPTPEQLQVREGLLTGQTGAGGWEGKK